MKAEFTMHISVTERNVIKQQIDKFYSNPEGMEQENGGDNTQVDDNTQE